MSVDAGSTVALRMLKALAEPVRWEIVEQLAREECCVCHLVDDLGYAQPLVSHHLKALREAGLVTGEPHGSFTYYRLRPDALAALAGSLDALAEHVPEAGRVRRPCC